MSASLPFIMAAPNGARRGKLDHPNLPITLDEIVAEAKACRAAGADALHLHIRDRSGQHSLDPGLYAEALDALAEAAPEFPIQITTESAGLFNVSQQIATIDGVQPKAASVAIREVADAPDLAPRLYGLCAEIGTEVQHILYSPADLQLLMDWQRQGIIPQQPSAVLFVLGRYAPPSPAHVSDLEPFLDAKPDTLSDWMICAFGPNEQTVLLAAAARGGQLRVGFENNLTRPDGTLARSTAENVAKLRAALTHTSNARDTVI